MQNFRLFASIDICEQLICEPVSGTQEREPRVRARVGRPEKEMEWPSPDEQYDFAFI
jgi:hypothetical protein